MKKISNSYLVQSALWVLLISAWASAQDLTGIYRIDLPGSVSTDTRRERVDGSTVQRTDTTTIGVGSRGAGTLVISPDGTYEIRDYLGYGKLRGGKWRENNTGPFSDKGGIELIGARPNGTEERDSFWYVFINGDGEVEGREPPHSYYNRLRLTRSGARPKAVSKGAEAKTGPGAKNAPSAPPINRTPGRSRRWTIDEFRAKFHGMSDNQVREILGEPDAVDRKTWTISGLQVVDPADNTVLRSVYMKFTELPGGTVWHTAFF